MLMDIWLLEELEKCPLREQEPGGTPYVSSLLQQLRLAGCLGHTLEDISNVSAHEGKYQGKTALICVKPKLCVQ